MNLHEYQAKLLFARYGLSVPRSYVCKTVKEVENAIIKLGNSPWVAKCQIHAGGRGKAGGVKVINNYDEAKLFIEKWLGKHLVTYQTDIQGQIVKKILLEEFIDINKEFYLGIVIDYVIHRIIFVASTEGGIEIENVAKQNPEFIHKVIIDPLIGPMPYQGRKLAFKLGLSSKKVEQFSKIFIRLVSIFIENDLALIEINPLVITQQGNLICLDGRIHVDSNALYRQVELQKLRDISQEDPYEVYASECGLNYITLNGGNIGCMVNGAGLAMGIMDIIKFYGGDPANFLDIGGMVTKEKVRKAFEIILSNDNVSAILVNIFGGIVRCDLIADGIISIVKEIEIKIPIIVRLEGNNAAIGKQKLLDSHLKFKITNSLTDAVKKVVTVVTNNYGEK